MNKLHEDLLREVKTKRRKADPRFNDQKYLGHQHRSYHLVTGDIRQIAKDFLKKNSEIKVNEIIKLLTDLYGGESYDEKVLASFLLGSLKIEVRGEISLELIPKWIRKIDGWAEIDSLCYGNFTASEILKDWGSWKNLLKDLARNETLKFKRSSLVFLIKPVRENSDKRLAKLALENVSRVKGEESILVTKAVSWILRALITNHRSELEKYLKEHEEVLPVIAVREVKNKLQTGKKVGRMK